MTNEFSSEYTYAGGGMNYRLNQKKYNFSTGFSIQNAMLNGINNSANTKINQEFKDILPSAMFQYNFSQTKNLNFNYRTSTNQPSLTQLQPVLDQSNINNQTIGNPNLKQTFQHNVFARYTGVNTEKSTSTFIMLGGTYTDNYIGNSTIIANNDTIVYDKIFLARGSQISRQENLNNNYNLRLFFNYSFPIKPIKSNLNIS